MRIVICDDDVEFVSKLSQWVLLYGKTQRSVGFEVCCFANPFLLLEEMENGAVGDLYLLDIYMPEISGLQVASELRKHSSNVQIIFLTSSREHAIEAFDLDAVHYLQKPVTREKFFAALVKALAVIERSPSRDIWLKTVEGTECFNLSKVAYIESIGRYQYVILNDGKICEVRETLSIIAAMLKDDDTFISPHRSFIVNLKYIAAIKKDLITMNDGKKVPIARSEAANVKKLFIDEIFEQ